MSLSLPSSFPSYVKEILERGDETLSLCHVLKLADFGPFHWTVDQVAALRALITAGHVTTDYDIDSDYSNGSRPPLLQFESNAFCQFMTLLKDIPEATLGPRLWFRTDVLTNASTLGALVEWIELEPGRFDELCFVKSYLVPVDTYSAGCVALLRRLLSILPAGKLKFRLCTSNGSDGENARRILAALGDGNNLAVPITHQRVAFEMGFITPREAQQIVDGMGETKVLTDWSFPNDFDQDPQVHSLSFIAKMMGTNKVCSLEAGLFDGNETHVDPDFVEQLRKDAHAYTTMETLTLYRVQISKTAPASLFNTVFRGLNFTEDFVRHTWKLTVAWQKDREITASAETYTLDKAVAKGLPHIQGLRRLYINGTTRVDLVEFTASLRGNYSLHTIEERRPRFANDPQVQSILKRNKFLTEAKKLTGDLKKVSKETSKEESARLNEALIDLLARLASCEDDVVSLPALYHTTRNALVHFLVDTPDEHAKVGSGQSPSLSEQVLDRKRHHNEL